MSEGVLICGHCDQAIKPTEPYQTFMKVSMSGGGACIEVHERCVEKPRYVTRTQRSINH